LVFMSVVMCQVYTKNRKCASWENWSNLEGRSSTNNFGRRQNILSNFQKY
jgi:hypothetical protein